MNRDLSVVARSAKVDHLDEAIDHVAARLTHAEDDPALVARIVDALPERSGGTWQRLLPRLAITTVLAVATTLIVLMPFGERSTTVVRTENSGASIAEQARTVTAAAPPTPIAAVRTPIVERPENHRRTTVEPSFNVRRADDDHEFSLPAIAAPQALAIVVSSPDALPVDGALVVAPLAIADLPLAGEPFSQRF